MKQTHDPSTGQAEAGGLSLVLGQAELYRETLTPTDITLRAVCVVDIGLLLGAYGRF